MIKTFCGLLLFASAILTSCEGSSSDKIIVEDAQINAETEASNTEEYRLNNGTADDPPESRIAPDETEESSLTEIKLEADETEESSLNEIDIEHNWQCYFCRIIIQKTETPQKTVCKEAEAEQRCGGCTHSWRDLGECGSKTYQCYYCHEIIKSKDKPLNVICRVAEAEQRCGGCTHSWKIL